MLKQIILGQIRHAATGLGGALVAHGFTNSSGAQQFTGAIMVLAGIGWSALQKYLTSNPQSSKL